MQVVFYLAPCSIYFCTEVIPKLIQWDRYRMKSKLQKMYVKQKVSLMIIGFKMRLSVEYAFVE